jgi:tetratricopeptide (TPR) repeat protein
MKKTTILIAVLFFAVFAGVAQTDYTGVYTDGLKAKTINCYDIDTLSYAIPIPENFDKFERVVFVVEIWNKPPGEQPSYKCKLLYETYKLEDLTYGKYKDRKYILFFNNKSLKQEYKEEMESKIRSYGKKGKDDKQMMKAYMECDLAKLWISSDPKMDKRSIILGVYGGKITGYQEQWDSWRNAWVKEPVWDFSTELFRTEAAELTNIKHTEEVQEKIKSSYVKGNDTYYMFPTIEEFGCTNTRGSTAQLLAKIKLEKRAEGSSSSFSGNPAAKAADLCNKGWAQLLDKEYAAAMVSCEEGIKIDPSDLHLRVNLAHAYLLLGSYDKALGMYKKYAGQYMDAKKSWESVVKSDFDIFRSKGITSPDMDKVQKELGIK